MLLVAGNLISCNDNVSAPFSVIGDSYIINRVGEEDIIFAQAYWAYGTQAMQSAKVTNPEGEEIILDPISTAKNIYALEPTLSDFSSELPVEGEYLFEVSNEDISHETTDLVTSDMLDIPVIDTAYYVDMRESMVVTWTPDGASEKYMVKMTDLDGNLIFSSNLLNSSQSAYEIERSAGSWFSYVQPGETYSIELHGILYEPTATNEDFLYNVQEISIGVSECKWGE